MGEETAMTGPPRHPSEADITWSISNFGRGGTPLGYFAALTTVVPAAFSVHSFFLGDRDLGALFALAVVAQIVILALFSRRQYMLGPGGVALIDLPGRKSHRWSEFKGYKKREADVLLLFAAGCEQPWFRLPDPPSPEEVEACIKAHLPEMQFTPEEFWQRSPDNSPVQSPLRRNKPDPQREGTTMSNEFGYLVVPATLENPRNTEGDIVELADGRLLLVWSDFYGGEMPDHAPARISAMISDDQGRTWGEKYTVQENVGGQNVMSASLLRLACGELLLFYLVKNADDDLQAYARRSTDEAATWGEPLMITDGTGYHVMNNARVIQLDSGRLLAPCAWNPGTWRELGEKRNAFALAYFSDDDGRSWQKCQSEVHLPGLGCQEPGVVELSDGRLLMILRNSLGTIHKSYSGDQGVTWSEAESTGIGAPVAPSTIVKVPSTGDLLLIWNDCFRDGLDAEAVRRPLTSAISRDDGETWERRRDLETQAPYWYAYVSVTFVGDRALRTYWVHDRRPDPNLLSLPLRSRPVSWFYQT